MSSSSWTPIRASTGYGAATRSAVGSRPAALAISIVTLAELAYGAASSTHSAANQQAIDDLVSGLAIAPLDPLSARTFGTIKASLRARGQLIEDMDLLIGATALVLGLTLVTGNVAHFQRIPGLRLEQWT